MHKLIDTNNALRVIGLQWMFRQIVSLLLMYYLQGGSCMYHVVNKLQLR